MNIKIDINDKYFCYILGLLWGDGYLYKGRVGISMISEDLEKLIYLFNKIGTWRLNRYKRKNKNWKEQLTLRVTDDIFYNFLVSMDYNNKSNTSPYKILKTINENNVKYFIRGLFDADGSFYLNKNTRQCIITSNYEQDWTFLSNLYDEKGWKFSINRQKSKTGNRSSIRITNKNIIEFSDYIYGDDFFGLERKYLKSIEIKESYNKKIIRVSKNKKKIYINDKLYDSITEASKITGIDREVIRYRLKSKNYNYVYEKI